MLYLVVKCSELNDQWECDADRTPICLTDDISKYGLGYEVYQLNSDNTFTLIKKYKVALDFGMALYQWDEGAAEEYETPIILEKWKEQCRDSITMSQVKEIKSKIGFSATAKEIFNDIQNAGSYGETVQGKYVVFGEYGDGCYSLGY